MSNVTLHDLLQKSIALALGGVNTAIPGRVVTYYPEERKVDVQPVIRRQMADGTLLEYPTILSVPVQYPSSSKSMFYFPLEKGDSVLIVFCQVSSDNWCFSDSTSPVDPEDNSRFNLSDAFVIPGINPFPLASLLWNAQTLTNSSDSVIIKHNLGTSQECQLVLSQNGTVTMTSPTKVKIEAPELEVDGDITASGDISTESGDILAGLTSLKLHIHGGVTSGPAVTSPPVV